MLIANPGKITTTKNSTELIAFDSNHKLPAMKFAISPRWKDTPPQTPAPGDYIFSPCSNGRNAVMRSSRLGPHMGIGERPCSSASERKSNTPGPGVYRSSLINTGSSFSTRRGFGMGDGVRGHQTNMNFNNVVLNRKVSSHIGPGSYSTEKWNRPLYEPGHDEKRPVFTTKKGKFFRQGGAFKSLLVDTSR